jgi:hypothetical protein
MYFKLYKLHFFNYCKYFSQTFLVAQSSKLAYNVTAAWRGGGFHCRSDEPHICKVKQNFGRDKAAILPNCTLSAGGVSWVTTGYKDNKSSLKW